MIVEVRFTEDEAKLIRAAAERKQQSVAQYIQETALYPHCCE